MTNIIGDIAGQYKSLLKLVEKMPEGDIISVGDMIDRGPSSKEVLDYFIDQGPGHAIMGNHEHMMVDHLTDGRFYDRGTWLWNGGNATLESFDPTGTKQNPVPQEYLDWMSQLAYWIMRGGAFISHSFVANFDVEDQIGYACDFGDSIWDRGESTIIWNRGEPVRRRITIGDQVCNLQVCGHNSQFGLREWRDDQGLYAICLDDCRNNVLTGLNLETMTIYQQPYLE